MPKSAQDDKKPAVTKRLKISKAQQHTLLEVLGASLILGAAAVLSVFCVKYINLNIKVISAKNEAIEKYRSSLYNIGVCADTNNDGKLSNSEIEKCNPNNVSINEVPGSLRDNIVNKLSNNPSLESIARDNNLSYCFDSDGKKIDFTKKLSEAKSEEQESLYLEQLASCSALRAIPDAIPSNRNEEAILSSLNQLFIVSNWDPESIAPSTVDPADIAKYNSNSLAFVPVSFEIKANTDTVFRVISNIERSIREFDIHTATVEWSGDEGGSDNITFSALATTFYTQDMQLGTEKVEISAKGGVKHTPNVTSASQLSEDEEAMEGEE